MAAAGSVECSPTSEALCTPCEGADIEQSYCFSNGFKQEVRCHIAAGTNGSDTPTSYVTFSACHAVPGDVLGVVKFELLMLICFGFSFRFVRKRKRQRSLAQLARIESYDSTV